jgi:phosphatidylserine/phosphatidylglycerophosphate/cardiolipin synthase-like enzyme
MKPVFRTVILILILATGCGAQEASSPSAITTIPPIEVHFSPKGGCTEAIVKEITAAKSTILVQAYSFTSAPIAKALVEAHKRGVEVQAILDKSQRTEKYSSADFLHNTGISVRIDAQHAIAHNKVMVIDGQVVITGSFNFTKAAEEKNAENLLVIRDKGVADKYTDNWQAHCRHSERYQGREARVKPDEPTIAATDPQPSAAATGQASYVASKNSEVFHRADCKSAAKIAARNVIRYNTRDEAVSAGKRPCAECRP